MNSALKELPAGTFSLTSRECPEFVSEVSERFEVSKSAASVCLRGLNALFATHGGFSEQPTDDKADWSPYHNGSHAGMVMGVGVFLAHKAGEETPVKDAIAIGGVYHDWYKGHPEPGRDEEMSAAKAQEVLEENNMLYLSEPVQDCILGTIVDQNDIAVVQRARKSESQIAKYLADADLSSLIAPNAAEWALRLQIENRLRANQQSWRYDEISNFLEETKENMKSFLDRTLSLERTHNFLSSIGKAVLQPLTIPAAKELQKLDLKKPADYFRSD